MNEKQNELLKQVMVGLVGVGVALSAQSSTAAAQDFEKCYGVVKAGKNDCGNSKHPCAGASKVDGAADEWVLVPKGLCDKLVNGSKTAGK